MHTSSCICACLHEYYSAPEVSKFICLISVPSEAFIIPFVLSVMNLVCMYVNLLFLLLAQLFVIVPLNCSYLLSLNVSLLLLVQPFS